MNTLHDIPGWEDDYAITKSGKVWSYPKSGRGRSKHDGRWLTVSVGSSGYKETCLKSGGRVSIASLLATTFIDNPHKYSTVNHIDGNKLNDEIANLEWCTMSANVLHAYKLGLLNKGEKHASAKLSDAQVAEIRSRACSGETLTKIALDYPVCRVTIGRIVNNNSRL